MKNRHKAVLCILSGLYVWLYRFRWPLHYLGRNGTGKG